MQWEYRVIATNFTDGSEGERTLNDFGNQGWELVAQVPSPVSVRFSLGRWIFKRPKVSDQAQNSTV